MSTPERCDVIVVGGGSAAFAAAVAARTNGAERVVMLEKAPESEFGGNARFSSTQFRFPFEPEEIRALTGMSVEEFASVRLRPYSAQDFMSDLLRVTQGRIDRELAAVLVSQARAAVFWSKEVGLRWQLTNYAVVIDGLRYFSPGVAVHPVNPPGAFDKNGLSQLHQWRRIASNLDVDIRYGTTVIGMIGDAAAVSGVRVIGPEGEYEIQAPATIVCSGGFQANPEMRARYLGPNADLMKVRGSRHDTGEVLQMLLSLGAQPTGHWQHAHATPIDAAAATVEAEAGNAKRYSYPYTITVNELGQRFFDEGEAEVGYTYAKVGWAVLREPGGVAYQIGDGKTRDFTKDIPIEAPSLRDLADKIGIDSTILEHTVREFNSAIQKEIPFDRTRRDGRSTVGLTPNKSNWALELDTPPFYCYPVTGGITFTFGGIKVDANAQILGHGGRPIPGLYASGDIIGLFFHNYPSMTGQTRNLVFSRLAGQNAAASHNLSGRHP